MYNCKQAFSENSAFLSISSYFMRFMNLADFPDSDLALSSSLSQLVRSDQLINTSLTQLRAPDLKLHNTLTKSSLIFRIIINLNLTLPPTQLRLRVTFQRAR